MSETQSPPLGAKCGWLPPALQSQHSSDALMYELFEGNPDSVFIVDDRQRIVAANSRALKEFGYTDEVLIGQPVSVLLPEAARERHAGHVRSFLAHPSVRSMGSGMDLKGRDAHGNEFPVDVMLRPLVASSGQYVVAVCRRPDEALARSQMQVHALIDSVREYAINLLDARGRILTWNEGARRIHGLNSTEALGQNFSIFFLEDDVARGEPQRLLDEAARSGHSRALGWRRGANQSRIWAEVDFTALRDASGQLTGFTRVLHDLTANHKTEEALREAHRTQIETEERFRLMIEQVAEYAILMLDTEGRVTTWNAGAERTKGYRREEVLGQSYSIFFQPEDQAAGLPARELATAARDGYFAGEGWRRRKDGSQFWAFATLTAIHGPGGELRGFAKVTRDMTQQKLLERSLEQAAAELETRVEQRTRQVERTLAELKSKNEEVEAFVYIVSHDLRAPLVNVQGFVRELGISCSRLKTVLSSLPLPEQDRQIIGEILEEDISGALRFISASSSKFERLIEALLGLSRQGRRIYCLEPIDVRELVDNAIAAMQQMIDDSSASIRIGPLPTVTADRTALDQVFSNLICNSIKYRSTARPLEVEVGGAVEDKMVHYWVRDNGLGIPESGKAKLFQVFQRLHPKIACGEGMGLAIVHRIVERHGGKIRAESQDGEGTTFFFSLPAQPGNPPNEPGGSFS